MAAFVLSSCASTVSTRTSKTMDIYGPGVIHHPVLVDLDVKETKVTGSTTIINSSSEENGKRLAVIEALKDSGADVLVQPVYQIETKGSRTTYTVTGFPATYKNPAHDPQDIPWCRRVCSSGRRSPSPRWPVSRRGAGRPFSSRCCCPSAWRSPWCWPRSRGGNPQGVSLHTTERSLPTGAAQLELIEHGVRDLV
ncbi:MAG: hypothetical protein IPM68_03145 [Flavobacteriales bacterium]|nr:hypothetical protein [Flavobacteriales bacterium]